MKRGKQRGGAARAHKQKKRKERAERLRQRKAAEREGTVWSQHDPDFEVEVETLRDPDLAIERLLRRLERAGSGEPLEMASETAAALADAFLAGELVPRPADDDDDAQDEAFFAVDALLQGQDARALRHARAALSIDPTCCDARMVLAVLEGPAKGVADLEAAVRDEERRLGADFLERERGRFWALGRTRPYCRALNALAEQLWCAGRADESFRCMERLLELAPHDPMQVRLPLLARSLELGRVAEAQALAARFRADRSAEMRWGRVLLHLASGRRSQAARALESARRSNALVEPYLRGELPVPGLPPDTFRRKSPEEARLLAFHLGRAWRAQPGAAEWLREQARPEKPRTRRRTTRLDFGRDGEGWCRRDQLDWWSEASKRFLARLALEVSGIEPGRDADLALRCRQRPDHRPCRGELHATRAVDGDGFAWRCKRCGARGTVAGWSSTFLGAPRAAQSASDSIAVELASTERDQLLEREDLYARSWALLCVARREGERFVLRAGADDLRALLGCVATSLLREPASFFPALERRLRAALGRGGEASRAERAGETLLHRAVLSRDVGAPRSSARVLLRAELEGVSPPVLRELEVPACMSLRQLHLALQLAFGWSDAHPHRFLDDGEPSGDERRLRLEDGELRPGEHCEYVYGPGEAWRLRLTVVDLADAAPLAVVLRRTEGAAPAEDRGNDPQEALDLDHRARLVAALSPRLWGGGSGTGPD